MTRACRTRASRDGDLGRRRPCASLSSGNASALGRSSAARSALSVLGRAAQDEVMQGLADTLPPPRRADQQVGEATCGGALAASSSGSGGQLTRPGGRSPQRQSRGVPPGSRRTALARTKPGGRAEPGAGVRTALVVASGRAVCVRPRGAGPEFGTRARRRAVEQPNVTRASGTATFLLGLRVTTRRPARVPAGASALRG